MSTERDLHGDFKRVVRSWLREDRHEDVDRVLGAVLDEVDTTPQRRSTPWSAWRDLFMDSNVVRVGLVAAVAAVAAVIAFNLLPGSLAPGSETTPTPSAAPSSTPEASATPEATPAAYVMALPGDSGGQATVMFRPGWSPAGFNVNWNNNLFLAVWPDHIANVYGDPCQWEGSLLDPPVGPTVDDLATALADQPTRDATVEDASLGGYSGQVVHMSVPADINFGDCDLGQFGSWTIATSDQPDRYHQGPRQLDDIYILDVEGLRVVVDVAWFPSSPAERISELEEMLATLTIQP